MLKSCRVHTTLPVSDLAQARVFYENTLGIPPTTELSTGIFAGCGSDGRWPDTASEQQFCPRCGDRI